LIRLDAIFTPVNVGRQGRRTIPHPTPPPDAFQSSTVFCWTRWGRRGSIQRPFGRVPMIATACSACGQSLPVCDSHPSRVVRCPACGVRSAPGRLAPLARDDSPEEVPAEEHPTRSPDRPAEDARRAPSWALLLALAPLGIPWLRWGLVWLGSSLGL